MRIDIIIATCKKLENLKEFINEIENNTPEYHRVICTCQPLSASVNRNYGLSYANSDILVMCDDDITGFYPGWLTNLIFPLLQDKNIIVCSARLLNKDKTHAPNMGMVKSNDIYSEIKSSYNINDIEYKRVTTACIAFKKNNIKFDEKFQGSGYEDTCFMNQISEKFNGMKFIVNNQCELIHLNNMVGQRDKNIWLHNHNYYCKKYSWDIIAKSQAWWVKE